MEIILALLSRVVDNAWTVGKKTWDDIIFALQGKKIAVLGQRAVGKSSLLKCAFEEKDLEDLEKYIQTLISKEVVRKHLKFDELDIRLKTTKDVSGSEEALLEWKTLFSESDIILYLVRTDKLFNNDNEHIERVTRDMEYLGEWMKDSQSKKQVFIVGNHWYDDDDLKFMKLIYKSESGSYRDEFNDLDIVKHMKRLAGGADKVKVALGCLKNYNLGIKLINEIFKQVEK